MTLGSILVLAGPAAGADTAASFDVEPGDLSVSAPASVDLGSIEAGTDSITGPIGPVTVTDLRGDADASWVASVISTDFTAGEAGPTETIDATAVSYWSGALSTTGDGTFTPAAPDAGSAEEISASTTAVTHTGGTGTNSATWNPTLIVSPSSVNLAGEYSGTVTHSVA